MVDFATELYRRKLPHIIQYDRELFVTFKTKCRHRLPPCARNIVLQRCVFGQPASWDERERLAGCVV